MCSFIVRRPQCSSTDTVFCPLKCFLDMSFKSLSFYRFTLPLSLFLIIYLLRNLSCLTYIAFPTTWSLLFSYSRCIVACASILSISCKLAAEFRGFSGLGFYPFGQYYGLCCVLLEECNFSFCGITNCWSLDPLINWGLPSGDIQILLCLFHLLVGILL